MMEILLSAGLLVKYIILNKTVLINDWENCGLKLPSIIRVHKIATLEKELVELVIGEIDNPLKIKIKTILANISE